MKVWICPMIAALISFSVSLEACQRERPTPRPRPTFENLGPIADNYAPASQPSDWEHDDLNGTWRTVTRGQVVNVTIDFESGVYSSDVPGTEELRLRLVREKGLEVVFELESSDGAVREEINCVFRDRDHISMIGNTGIPQEFYRVQ